MSQILWGNRRIAYSVERAARKTISITVKPDSSVTVRAPLHAADQAIENVILKRSSWIERQQQFFEQFQPRTTQRQYIGGETHLYLGRRYRLRLRESETSQVGLINGYLCVCLTDPTEPYQIKYLLDTWYLQRADDVFKERLRHCRRSAVLSSLPEPKLSIRRMRTRWGSCSSAHRLTINPDLIRAPRMCIDYVIVHELCHLIHHNHSRDFYNLLAVVMPDWEERKLRLERLLS